MRKLYPSNEKKSIFSYPKRECARRKSALIKTPGDDADLSSQPPSPSTISSYLPFTSLVLLYLNCFHSALYCNQVFTTNEMPHLLDLPSELLTQIISYTENTKARSIYSLRNPASPAPASTPSPNQSSSTPSVAPNTRDFSEATRSIGLQQPNVFS